jgi:integrase
MPTDNPTDRKRKIAALATRPGTEGEGRAATAALTRLEANAVTEHRPRFTDDYVARLPVPAAGYKLYRDGYDYRPPRRGQAPPLNPVGFGVRVHASGKRVFVLSYTTPDGVDGRKAIGPFGEWTVQAARAEADDLLRKIKKGSNPAKEERERRQAQTVAELCDAFLKDRADKRPATLRMYTQIITKEIKPALGRHKAALVERSHIRDLHREIAARAPYQSNRVLATIKAIFNFGIEEEIVTKNPCIGIEAKPEQKRKRYLKPDELTRLHAALAAHKDQRVANLFRLMLWTGARIGETLAARWADFDLTSGVWVKPGLTTKTHTDHEVVLNPPARNMLRQMRADASDDDAMVFRGMTYDGIKDDWSQLLEAAGITNFRRHDLRHSFASAVLSAGFGLSDVGALLGHSQATTTHRYAHLVDGRLRAATDAAGAVLAGGRKGEV